MIWSAPLPPALGLPLAAHPDAPLPRLVDLAQLLLAVRDLPAGREVGPLDVLEQILGLELAVVDERHRRLAHLAEVVGRDVGGHADGDPGAAVDEQLRDLGRQHDRLLGRAVVVGAEVDRPLLDLGEQLHRQRREARLGVAVGGRRIAVERAEVAVPVDQRARAWRTAGPCAPSRRSRRCRRAGGTCPAPRRRWSRTCGTWRPGRGAGSRTSRTGSAAAPASSPSRTSGSARDGDDADRVVEVAALRLRAPATRRPGGGGSPPSPGPPPAASAAAGRGPALRQRPSGWGPWLRTREDPTVGTTSS